MSSESRRWEGESATCTVALRPRCRARMVRSVSIQGDPMYFFAELLNQQFWCFGKDIEYAGGNLLIRYGMTRQPPPKGRECSSLYQAEVSSKRRLVLRGFGAFYGGDDWGGLFLSREAIPQLTSESHLRDPAWTISDLPPMREPEQEDRARLRWLLLELIDWFRTDEVWVTETVGSTRGLQGCDQVFRRRGVLHIWRSWINQFARYSMNPALLLEFDTEVGSVRGIRLDLAECGGSVVAEIDRRITAAEQCIRGIFLDPGQNRFAGIEEVRKAADTEGVSPIAAVRRPLLHLLGVERCLRADHGGAPKSGRLAGHWVSALGVGQVIMKCQPQAGTGTRRTARRPNPRFVEIPFRGLAADKLQRPCRVVKRGLDRRPDAVLFGVPDEPVVDRHDRYP